MATGDVEILLTLNRKQFIEIPNTLMCEGRLIYVVVEGRRLLCWAYGAAIHLSKACPGKNGGYVLTSVIIFQKGKRKKQGKILRKEK